MRRLASILVLALAASVANAEDSTRSGQLFDELAAMDRELFEAAFVNCDREKFRSLFTEDAEFYHDRDGAMTGRQATELRGCPGTTGSAGSWSKAASRPIPSGISARSRSAATRSPGTARKALKSRSSSTCGDTVTDNGAWHGS